MNIVVCLKLVPATTADIRVAADGSALQLSGVEMVVSPYDEYALEAALKTREAFPGSTITAVTVGPDEASKCLTQAFSVGADSAIHIKESDLDAASAARVVAAAIKDTPPDLVLCGRQAIDDDQWLFPGALAELLNIPHVTAAASLEINEGGESAQCRRRFNDEDQLVEVRFPALISCDKGMNEPRSPTLKGRLDAKKKQPSVKSASDLDAGALAAGLTVTKHAPPPEKTPGKVIDSPAAEAAAELVRLLREEAKVL
jgi:electron transfer flavoprotein beta subunit